MSPPESTSQPPRRRPPPRPTATLRNSRRRSRSTASHRSATAAGAVDQRCVGHRRQQRHVPATFTVTRTGDLSGAFDVYYATANGSAAAPGDYTAVATTPLHFAAGETTKTVSVAVVGDLLQESAETFLVNLSSVTGATIADGIGVGTIQDNEARLTATGRTGLKLDKKNVFTGVVASFTSGDFNSANNFSAVINWGDGTSSAGQIVWNSSTQRWDVIGTHKYAKKSNFTLLIVLTDANGATAQASGGITK